MSSNFFKNYFTETRPVKMAIIDIERLSRELSPHHIRAIRALLSEPSKTAAAQKAEISRQTLWRWLKKPAFQEAVIAGTQEQIEALWADVRKRNI
jgi:predicted DNA-binding protein (UPF0251 family)